MLQPLAALVCALVFFLPASPRAQGERVFIDRSRMPAEAATVEEFIPAGWVVEEQVSGDLNADALPDFAVKLIQQKRAAGEGEIVNRHRALLVLFKGRDGRLTRAAVADRLLQCTACGGAFYGVVEAPADVKIERGVIVVSQEHGSRNVTETTYRFRYDPASKNFLLIGLDLIDRDRATGETVNESTNYLTGLKITKRFRQTRRETTSRTRVPRKRVNIEQADHEAL